MDHYSQMTAGAGDDEESASLMMEEEPAETPPKGGMVVDNVSIRQAKNGGWIVTCSKHQDTDKPNMSTKFESNDYTFSSLAEAVPFIESEFGASAESGQMPGPAMPTGAMAG